MSPNASERELLEQLMIDVAVIKDKIPLLEKISDCLTNLKDNCRVRHEELERSRHARHQNLEARFSGLEAEYQVSQALRDMKDSWTARQKALFWSAAVAVATAAQVLTTLIIHLLSRH
jgi:anti-sigma factor RsiW